MATYCEFKSIIKFKVKRVDLLEKKRFQIFKMLIRYQVQVTILSMNSIWSNEF
jgi:hypothetical protein